VVAALSLPALAAAASSPLPLQWTPARRESGALPPAPTPYDGPGVVAIEVTTSAEGDVVDATVLRATPPFASALRDAVAGWRFEPARSAGQAVASRVLVVGLYRPPSLFDVGGSAAPSLEEASPEVPAPMEMPLPPYPPLAIGDGRVLLELHIEADGRVETVRSVSGAEPFTASALATVARWCFRPALLQAEPVASFAYVFVSYRAPVLGPRPAAR
jgi:TonB family protein